jgi:GntR family transcriptional regulator of arabinose operon
MNGEFRYKTVLEWLKERINDSSFEFGQKLPSENFLCSKFSVSRQTVRKAYDELENENFVYSIRGSGYFVKKESQGQQQKTIGVILSYLADHMFPSILLGIQQVLYENSYGMNLGITENTFYNERKCLEVVDRNSNIAGLIVEGTRSALPNPNLDLYQKIRSKGIPIVFIHNYYRDWDAPAILMDDIGAEKEMTELMIKAGHYNIGGAFKYDDLQGHRRFQGFSEALIENGISVNDDVITWFSSKRRLWAKDKYGFLVDPSVFEKVTAYVCYNDMLCEEIIGETDQYGISIPEAVSITGFDDENVMLSNGHHLTSAKHPKEQLGVAAAKKILDIIDGNLSIEDTRKIIMPTKVVIRDSILPPKKNLHDNC